MKLFQKSLLVTLITVLVLCCNWATAQISEGGSPPSFAYPSTQLYKQSAVLQPTFDVKRLKAEDKQRESDNLPLRVSIIIPADLSIDNSGEWATLPDGQQVWRLNISSPGAIATMLYYDEFYIPEGGKLFIYNKAKNHVIGAYTNKTNPKISSFATEFVAGDNLILEYVAPAGLDASPDVAINKGSIPRIKISGIGYGYNYLSVYHRKNGGLETYAFGESKSCQVNINCTEGDNWQDQKKGVAKSITPIAGRGYLCSGTIINNTAQNLTPYFLTAQHCFYDDNGAKPTVNEWNQIVYYFHYESPNCTNPGADPVASAKTITGAQLLVELPINGSSDGVLLKLNNSIPESYNVYYNGWDRRNIPATSGVGIHHPAGDIKKISTYTAPAESTYWNGSTATGAPNAHWNIIFTATVNGHSVTEGGSSGSPMFNQNGLVVGTLSGGSSTCANTSGRNLYGKLWYHWDNNNTVNPSTTMRDYLDPLNTGQETLSGTYIPQTLGAAFGASATNIYALQAITYTNYTAIANTYEWTFEGGTPATSTVKNPPAVTYNIPGTYQTKLIINKGTAEEEEATKTITVTEKGINPVVPVAQFAVASHVLLEERFDVAVVGDFPPIGWFVEKPGVSTSQWEATNGNSNFNLIDPSSKFSAMVAYDDDNVVETWLKMNSDLAIPLHANLDFYAGYSGIYLSGGYTTLYASTDGGATWTTELWTTGQNNIPGLTWAWRKQTIDLAAYAGQNVRFAWRYYGQGGDLVGIDGVVLSAYKPDEKLTINIGDYIEPVDLSTGPPILYEWSFPGGEPETFDKENPEKVRYMTPGTYDVALKVKNYRGEDTRTLTGAVTVNELLPVAAYDVNTYTRRENNGLFLPAGAEVDFTDKSLNYPTSWEWTFEGGESASSSEQNPNTVKFNTEGEFNFKFKAINGAGTDEIAITKGTKVGNTRDTIWNLAYGEKDSRAMYRYTYGFITGTNTWDITSYAERFDAPLAPAAITAVKVNMLAAGTDASHQLQVSIAKVGNNGNPGTIIASTTLMLTDVKQTAINQDRPTLVEFAEPVTVSEPYFIVVGDPTGSGGNFDDPGYTAAIITSANRGATAKNTAYSFDSYDGTWKSFSKAFVDFSVSMDVAPVITYVDHKGVDTTKFYFKNIDPTVATVNMKSNLPWQATTNANWITIVNGSGEGDGTFTFTVNNNKSNPRKAIIKVSAGEAYTDYILVQQAASGPNDLTAVITDDEAGDILLTWKAPEIKQPYKPGDDIFEDAEEHPDFLNASPDYYGWKYLDLDGQPTFGFNGIVFPGMGEASSFRVFTPSKTTPPGSAASNSHDGSKKYFAAFSADNNTVTNDWMISPKLGFTEQSKVSFWARAYSDTYEERLRVLYSTTGDDSADFTNGLTPMPYQVLPATWTRYEYTLPANAKYVAFNYVSDDAFVMFIDNIFIGIGEAPQSMQESVTSSGALGVTATREAGKKNDNSKKTRINELTKVDIRELASEKIVVFKDEVTGETIEVIRKAITTEVSKEEKSAPKFEVANNEDKKQTLPEEHNTLNSEQSLPTVKLGYGGNANVNVIGFNATTDVPVEVAIRFTPTDLLPYHNTKMKAVDVYLKNVPSDGITLKIRQGDKVYRQQVASLGANMFTRISLNKELRIDASKDLYVGYEYVQRNKQYTAGVGAGPAVIGKGDLIGANGSPLESLYDLSASGLNYNWNIALLLEDNKDVVTVKYNVYRDNALIATVDKTTLTDVLTTQSNACYEVKAVYNGESESTPSNTACVTLKQVIKVNVADTSRWFGSPNPDFVISYNGFIDGDTEAALAVKPTATTTAIAGSPVGTYPITASGGSDSKYRFNYVEGTLTVKTQSVLTITVANADRYYGQANPNVSGTYTITGFIDGDDETMLQTLPTVSIDAAVYNATKPVNTYPSAIVGSDAVDATGKYTFAYQHGMLTIKAQPVLTVTIANADRYYGQANPNVSGTYTITGFVDGDDETMLQTLPTVSIDAAVYNATKPVNTYPSAIVGSDAVDATGKYTFAYQHGMLTIKAQPILTITVANAERYYGQANPNVSGTYTITGFIDNDDATMLQTLPTVSIDAAVYNATKPANTYAGAIIGSGAVDATGKYTFAYQHGMLTIKPCAVVVTAVSGVSSYGDSPVNPGISADGLVLGETVSVLTGLSNSFGITPTTSAGNHVLTVAGTSSNNNYSVSTANGTWKVSKTIPTLLWAGSVNWNIAYDGSPKSVFAQIANNFGAGSIVYTYELQGSGIPSTQAPTNAGVYTVTASLLESNNFAAATPIKGILTITASGSTSLLDEVLINGFTHDINTVYNLECENSASIEVKAQQGATVSTGNNFTLTNLKVGLNEIPISISSGNSSSSVSYILKINTNLVFNNYVVQKKRHVFMLNLNKLLGEGINVVGSKWYKNNQLVGTKNYFTEGDNVTDVLDPSAEYYFELTTADGKVYKSCIGKTIVAFSNKMITYPNPVAAGTTVTVKTGLDIIDLQGAMVKIYDTSGRCLSTTPANDSNISLTAPSRSGMYIIKLTGNGLNEEFKVIVK